MTVTHLVFLGLLKGAWSGYVSWCCSWCCWPTEARPRILLLPKQLLHRANIDLVLLLPHRQRPDVRLPAHLLLWDRLPVEAADPALFPPIVVGWCVCQGRRGRRCPRRWGREGRRGRQFILGGVRKQGGLTVPRHRRRVWGSDGGSGAAAPLAATALWLICCGCTTHNKHRKVEQSAYSFCADTN